MSFKELTTHVSPNLNLPINGQVYSIKPVDAETGLWVQTIFTVAIKAKESGRQDIDDEDLEALKLYEGDNRDLFQRILGDTFAEMMADKVDFETLKLVAVTTMMWITNGIDAAEDFWNAGGEGPKALKKPSDHKAKKKPSAKKTSTA